MMMMAKVYGLGSSLPTFFFFVILVDEAGQVLSIPVGVDPKVVDVYRHIFDW